MNIKHFKLNKKSLLYALVIIILFWFAFDEWGGSIKLSFDDRDFELQNRKITRLQSKLDSLSARLNLLNADKKNFAAAATSFWNSPRDGDPETGLRTMINNLCRTAGIDVASTGNMKKSTKKGLLFMGISVRGKGTIEEIAELLELAGKNEPALYWSSLNLTPERSADAKIINISFMVNAVMVEDNELRRLAKTARKGK